jgi:hypothetical protein
MMVQIPVTRACRGRSSVGRVAQLAVLSRQNRGEIPGEIP